MRHKFLLLCDWESVNLFSTLQGQGIEGISVTISLAASANLSSNKDKDSDADTTTTTTTQPSGEKEVRP